MPPTSSTSCCCRAGLLARPLSINGRTGCATGETVVVEGGVRTGSAPSGPSGCCARRCGAWPRVLRNAMVPVLFNAFVAVRGAEINRFPGMDDEEIVTAPRGRY